MLKSLKGKMIMYLIIPMIVTIVAINVIIANASFSSARQQAESNLQQEVLAIALEIDKENALAIRTANMLSLSQQSFLFGKRQASSEFAKATLTAFPDYAGAYFGYEPNADGQDAQSSKDIGTLSNDTGRFIPYWHRDNNVPVVVPLEAMDESLYYDGIKKIYNQSKIRQGLVTEPYLYQGNMIVEQTYPIVLNGEFVGIGGVDRALVQIEALLNRFKQQSNKDLILISREGRVISETLAGRDLKTKSIAETPFRQELGAFYRNKSKSQVSLEHNETEDKTYYFASAPIKSGEWMLVALEPETAVIGPIQTLFMKISLFSIIGILGLTAASLWMVNNISSRVNTVANMASKVAKGDLSGVTLNQSSNQDRNQDEISIMQSSMLSVADSYVEIEKSCVAIAEGQFDVMVTERCDNDLVAKSINSLTQRRKEVEEVLQRHSQRIQQSTQKQNSEIESVATSTNQMSATIGEVSSLATTSADGAHGAAESAKQTQQVISRTAQDVSELAEDIAEVSSAISQVAQSSDNIMGIVEVINMIAEQTNLLALNAAIEAARAGEHGRGFAVVADEVRTLASKTRSSTEEINDLISSLSSGVNSAVEKVDRGVSKAQSTIEQSSEAEKSLHGIVEQIEHISDHMTQIATAVEQQSVACDEINRNITVIHDEASELAAFTTQ